MTTTPRTLSDPTIGEGVLEPTEPVEDLWSTFDIQEYFKDQFARQIVKRMRAEPGMDWFSPGTPEPDDCRFMTDQEFRAWKSRYRYS